MQKRKPYEPPAIAVVGDVQSLTAGKVTPIGRTDFSYPAETKREDFRFYSTAP